MKVKFIKSCAGLDFSFRKGAEVDIPTSQANQLRNFLIVLEKSENVNLKIKNDAPKVQNKNATKRRATKPRSRKKSPVNRK